MFTCFKRNDKRDIKVAQLAGSVAEHSAYHHGEVNILLILFLSLLLHVAKSYGYYYQLGTKLCWKQQYQYPSAYWTVWY